MAGVASSVRLSPATLPLCDYCSSDTVCMCAQSPNRFAVTTSYSVSVLESATERVGILRIAALLRSSDDGTGSRYYCTCGFVDRRED
eukprot:715371-Amphidinium_carterae.2